MGEKQLENDNNEENTEKVSQIPTVNILPKMNEFCLHYDQSGLSNSEVRNCVSSAKSGVNFQSPK